MSIRKVQAKTAEKQNQKIHMFILKIVGGGFNQPNKNWVKMGILPK